MTRNTSPAIASRAMTSSMLAPMGTRNSSAMVAHGFPAESLTRSKSMSMSSNGESAAAAEGNGEWRPSSMMRVMIAPYGSLIQIQSRAGESSSEPLAGWSDTVDAVSSAPY